MNKYKILTAIFATLFLVSTVSATVLYTLVVPATVTVDSTAWTLYAPDCTTPITTVSFGTVAAGSSASLTFCLKNTGTYDQWITSSSVSSTLSPTVGTVVASAFGSFSLPLEFKPSNTAPITLTLTALANAPMGAQSFNIQIIAYSTSTG